LKVKKIAKIGGKERKGLADSIVRNDEVVGSIPTSSTNLLKHLPRFSSDEEHPLIGP